MIIIYFSFRLYQIITWCPVPVCKVDPDVNTIEPCAYLTEELVGCGVNGCQTPRCEALTTLCSIPPGLGTRWSRDVTTIIQAHHRVICDVISTETAPSLNCAESAGDCLVGVEMGVGMVMWGGRGLRLKRDKN